MRFRGSAGTRSGGGSSDFGGARWTSAECGWADSARAAEPGLRRYYWALNVGRWADFEWENTSRGSQKALFSCCVAQAAQISAATQAMTLVPLSVALRPGTSLPVHSHHRLRASSRAGRDLQPPFEETREGRHKQVIRWRGSDPSQLTYLLLPACFCSSAVASSSTINKHSR